MAKKIQVLMIEQEEPARQVVRTAVDELLGQVELMAETDSNVYGYELIRQNRPNMVFINLGNDPAKTLETVTRISAFFKDVFIVVTSSEVSVELIVACMQAGAREVLPRPFNSEQVKQLFEKHHLALTADPDQGDVTGRIVTVFSNKGGLGKTTIAVNLAMALSKTVKKPVALVDLNLQLGDITTFLDIEPKQTIVDIAKNIGRVDKAYLETSLAEFKTDDATVFVLADPLNVEEAEDLTSDQINEVLTVLRASFEYVVVDTTTSFDSKTLTALDLADDILLVSIVNLPSIRSTQRLLSLFKRLGYQDEKVKLIVNRFVPDEEISIEDVEDTLEHPVFWKIPNAYQVIMASINRGVPIQSVENSRSVVKNFADFATRVSGKMSGDVASSSESKENAAKSLLSGLFKGKSTDSDASE